jgi:hypothetical protein
VTAEQFDPAHIDSCNMCARRARELEAAQGLRCTECHGVFGSRPWMVPAEEDASLCPSCLRVAVYRATAPTSAGRWGSRGEA